MKGGRNWKDYIGHFQVNEPHKMGTMLEEEKRLRGN
jgi:hypothetical protein